MPDFIHIWTNSCSMAIFDRVRGKTGIVMAKEPPSHQTIIKAKNRRKDIRAVYR